MAKKPWSAQKWSISERKHRTSHGDLSLITHFRQEDHQKGLAGSCLSGREGVA
jgi:hypothetical protein